MYRVALVGNPNVGKTSLFNELTGSRHMVGNYPGVTVDVLEGKLDQRWAAACGDIEISLIDLPGIYSTTPLSKDESLAYAVLSGSREHNGEVDRKAPDAVIVVVNAANLARNLYLVVQIRELGIPCVVALNMIDSAREVGLNIDEAKLTALLGVPVVPTIARTGDGMAQLVAALVPQAQGDSKPMIVEPQDSQLELVNAISKLETVTSRPRARWLLCAQPNDEVDLSLSPEERSVFDSIDSKTRQDAAHQLISLRYAEVDRLLNELGLDSNHSAACAGTNRSSGQGTEPGHDPSMARSRQIDRVLTHRIWGMGVFLSVMALVFQLMFSWSDPFMGFIEELIGAANGYVKATLPPGLLNDLVTDGVITGVGAVLVFIPQIAFLFFLIGLLEDSGYLARAAFLIDKVMNKAGLSGKAFVPLLSGYACSIPAIMGTRTIASPRDRLVAILMIPYMSCSARLPVYALIIASMFNADAHLWGPFSVGGVLLLSMYMLSTVSALVIGAVFKKTILPGAAAPLVLELPPYRLPRVRNTLLRVWDRTGDFVRDAGSIILACTIVLWAMLTFPRVELADIPANETVIEHTVGGKIGKAFEPVLEPIGQDWRMGIGLIGSFAAREVLVATLGLVYGIEDVEDDDTPLRKHLQTATDPVTGKRRYTPLKGLALMVFFVYACQCLSTLAVVRRETRSWKWPLFMLVSMTVIAYIMALLVYQVGSLLGFE